MKEKIVNLVDLLKGQLYQEITHYILNLNIRQLFDKIPQREYLEKELKALEKIDKLDLKRIRELYKVVIPEISSSKQIPPPSVKNHIEKFENLWMKENITAQNKQIEDLKRENQELK